MIGTTKETSPIEEIYQKTFQRIVELKNEQKYYNNLRFFLDRLRWHCHFIQKLENQPDIEFKNLNKLYDNIRSEYNEEYFILWKNGKTGYPIIDAAMRSLKATGWINFRLRATLVSFASYNLFLPWQITSIYLAQLFTDYEPGIHYYQFQMQSGTTGINSLRIYNPIKQAVDNDPQCIFIKKWVEELKHVNKCDILTLNDLDDIAEYSKPIVDEKISRKQAASALYKIRNKSNHKEISNLILNIHH